VADARLDIAGAHAHPARRVPHHQELRPPSTRRTARCVISSRPGRPGPPECAPAQRGRRPAVARDESNRAAAAAHPTPPATPSTSRPPLATPRCARRPHVNPTRPRPSRHRERAPVRVNHPRQGEQMTATAFSKAARVLACLVAAGLFARPALAADGDVGGSVADSASGTPLPGGEVRVLRGAKHHCHDDDRCVRPLRHPQPRRGLVPRRGAIPRVPRGNAGRIRRGGPDASRLPPGTTAHQLVRGRGHVRRSARRRHADRQPDLQAERLPRRAHQHDVADPAAVHRRCRPGSHGRGPHPRPARRVHLLRGRRTRPGRDFPEA